MPWAFLASSRSTGSHLPGHINSCITPPRLLQGDMSILPPDSHAVKERLSCGDINREAMENLSVSEKVSQGCNGQRAPVGKCVALLIDRYTHEEDGESLKMESTSLKRQHNAHAPCSCPQETWVIHRDRKGYHHPCFPTSSMSGKPCFLGFPTS